MKQLLTVCALALIPHLSFAATVVKARAKPRSTPASTRKSVSEDKSDLRTEGPSSARAAEKIAPAKLGSYGAADDTERDAAADQRRDEAILELVQIVPTFDEGEQKADLLYRLAELYWEKAKYTYFQEFRAYDAQLEQWKGGPEPKLQNEKSEALKKQAIAVYEQILRKYPDYKRNDEVLFNKANALHEAGDEKQAVELYGQLIQKYPQSSYVPDTYLALGEHFFNANELAKAIVNYQRAVQANKAKIYGFALYKLAWCDYNAQDYPGALAKFKQVVDYSEQQATKKKRDRVQLRQEALKDMLLAFAQMDATEEARAYYAGRVDRDELGSTLGRLGALYEEQGKYELAVKAYRLVNDEWPNAQRAPQYQAAIINAYAQLQRRDKVREEVKRLVALYKPRGPWASANQSNPRALSDAYDLTERSLRELTLELHAEAQKVAKEGDPVASDKTYGLARDLYHDYLEAFSDSENAYKMRFNYAELLFHEKSYVQAAEQYDKVVNADAKGKFLKDAAIASVQAWEMITEGGSKDGAKMVRLEKGKSYPELPISAEYQKLAAACERFVHVLPNDPDVARVKFKEARIYFVHNHFEKASERFGEIIDRWPNDKLGRMAAIFVLEGYNVRERWADLNKYARAIERSRELTRDEQFAREVQDFLEGSAFKMVQQIEQQGDLAQAGARYKAFADEFPRSKHADLALYNATVINDKAGQLDLALASAEKLLREYPESAKKESVTFMVASFYERIGELEKALHAYEVYAAKFPKGQKSQDALFNVALFEDVLGMNKQAIASYERYLATSPRDASAVALKIGAIYERMGDRKKAIAHYSELEKRTPNMAVAAAFEAREKLAKLGVAGEAKSIWEHYLQRRNELKQNAAVMKVVAGARFELLEAKYREYIAIKLKLPQAAMTASLVRKAKLLAELEKDYADLLALGQGEYGIAALARIGMAYHDFSKALFEAPVPQGLSEDQREIYLSELQNKAFPIEEKAIEAYEKAIEKAQQLHVYTEWTQRTQDRLAQLKPASFPEVRRFQAQAVDQLVTK